MKTYFVLVGTALLASVSSAYTLSDDFESDPGRSTGYFNIWTGDVLTGSASSLVNYGSGNPGAYLLTSAGAATGGAGSFMVGAGYPDALALDPSVDTGVTSITFSFDVRQHAAQGAIPRVRLFAKQNGIRFYSDWYMEVTSTDWTHLEKTVTADDFISTFAAVPHLDFGSGAAPIVLGYGVETVKYNSDDATFTALGFDNVNIATQAVPEPATLCGLLLGSCVLARRKRRS